MKLFASASMIALTAFMLAAPAYAVSDVVDAPATRTPGASGSAGSVDNQTPPTSVDADAASGHGRRLNYVQRNDNSASRNPGRVIRSTGSGNQNTCLPNAICTGGPADEQLVTYTRSPTAGTPTYQ